MSSKLPDYIAFRIGRMFKSEPDTLIVAVAETEIDVCAETATVHLIDRNGINYRVTIEVA